MTYLAHVNQCIRQAIGARDQFVSFGQNIGAGSHLSGLTRNLPRSDRHRVINMPNCENGQVGFGFGLITYMVLTLPLVVWSSWTSLSQIPDELIDSSSSSPLAP